MFPPAASTSSSRRYRDPFLAVALTLVVGAAAACGGSSSSVSAPEDDDEPSPSLSFTAIQGDWEGVIERPSGIGASRWGDVSIARDSAPSKQVVGTFEYYFSEGDELLCIADLLAHTSTPPTYVFAYRRTFGEGEQCEEGGLFKFVHDTDADELVYFYKGPGAENFIEWGTFDRSE